MTPDEARKRDAAAAKSMELIHTHLHECRDIIRGTLAERRSQPEHGFGPEWRKRAQRDQEILRRTSPQEPGRGEERVMEPGGDDAEG